MIWYSFPASTAASHAFFVLNLAWSLADGIRYLYLALNLHKKAPQALVWLRQVNIIFWLYVGLTVVDILCFIPSTRSALAQNGG